MNFAEQLVEFYARGADYLSEDGAGVTRAERYLNRAYREICGLHPWPFLEAEANGGGGGLSIPDLRRILYVSEDTYAGGSPKNPLTFITYEDLIGEGVDVNITGTPLYYYVFQPSLIYTWPLTTKTIQVRYIKRVAPLTGTSEPLFDEEYHGLIIDRAMTYVYVDTDNFDAAALLKLEWEAQVQAMAEDYMVFTRDPGFIDPTYTYDG